ncbi:hypothetical protein [Fodinicurvata sediminis]|uniref:hypothetical protein n=1 Tax=Fodinicurvata sediminis TaxID=1121832 RepID=UPI0003B61FF0|nr:hypothetical protein [Fodinicurvata sediminis]
MARFLLYLFCLAQLAIAFLPLARVVVFEGLSGEVFGASSGTATLVMNAPVVASGFWMIAWLSLALLSYSFARLLAQQARMMKSLEKLPAREAPARDTAPRESRAYEEPAPEEPRRERRRERRAHREPALDSPPATGAEAREEPVLCGTPLRDRETRESGRSGDKPRRREPTLGTPDTANDER